MNFVSTVSFGFFVFFHHLRLFFSPLIPSKTQKGVIVCVYYFYFIRKFSPNRVLLSRFFIFLTKVNFFIYLFVKQRVCGCCFFVTFPLSLHLLSSRLVIVYIPFFSHSTRFIFFSTIYS